MRRFVPGNERGAVAVEFAVMLPVIALILFGTIQFGIALSRTEIFENAAREGARYAATHCRPQSVTGCTNALIFQRVDAAVPDAYAVGPGSPSCSDASKVCSEVLDPNTYAPTGKTSCDSSTYGWPVRVYWTQDLGEIDIPFYRDFVVDRTIEGVFRCEA